MLQRYKGRRTLGGFEMVSEKITTPIHTDFQFTFDMLEQQYATAIHSGYEIISCLDYAKREKKLAPLTIINRVDIDFSINRWI